MFAEYGIVFYVGALLIKNDHASIEDIFTSIFIIMFARMAIIQNQIFAIDHDRSQKAAKKVFDILEAKDEF